ncbi:hypothetical protein Hanom_Chr10g00899961 [Helianthus anomalus]
MISNAYVDVTKDTDKCRQTPIFIGEGIVSRVNEDNAVTSYTVVRVEQLNSPSNYLSLDMYSSETEEWIDYRLPCLNPVSGGSRVGFHRVPFGSFSLIFIIFSQIIQGLH